MLTAVETRYRGEEEINWLQILWNQSERWFFAAAMDIEMGLDK